MTHSPISTLREPKKAVTKGFPGRGFASLTEPSSSFQSLASARNVSPFAGPKMPGTASESANQSSSAALSARFQHDFAQMSIHPPDAVRNESIPYRARMEQTFGADFSAVQSLRGQSAWLAPLGARAAALPETVAFASNTPPPNVVAHELAHVLQYRNSPAGSALRRGVAQRGDPAEVEARRAAAHSTEGRVTRPDARPSAAPMLYTDEEDLDSEEFLQDRPPHFTNQEVGQWGQSVPATLVARERMEISFPVAERSNAILEAVFHHEPLVIMQEYHRLWLYRLGWEGLSARYSRFTNSSTLFSRAAEEAGGYAVSNVTGRREVEAFVTEDGGILSPPGAGKLFFHTGGDFEDPLVSGFENAVAFIGGLETGLEDADFAALAERLRRVAALNTVFPAPFALGAAHGIASEIIGLAQWLNPAQWQAVEAAARQTIFLLSDPDGEEVATAIGVEFGKTQAAALDKLLQKSLIVFAYEVGKLIGPVVVETVLGFIGIQIGPLAIVHKTLDLVEEAPRLLGILRKAKNVFQEIPDRPGFPRREGEPRRLPEANEMAPQAGLRAGPPITDRHGTPAIPSIARQIDQPVGNPVVASEREAQALLRRLGNGDGSVFSEIGITDMPADYDPRTREWGLGRRGDGTYVIIQGQRDRILWGHLNDITPVGHSHPLLEEMVLPEGGVPAKGFLDAEAAEDAAEMILPSGADVTLVGERGIPVHYVHTPFVDLGDGRIGNAPGGPHDLPGITIVIANARQIGSRNRNRIYSAYLLIQNEQGSILDVKQVWAERFVQADESAIFWNERDLHPGWTQLE